MDRKGRNMLFSFLLLFSVFLIISSIFFLLGWGVDALVLRLACSVSQEALVRLLLRNGCSSATLIMAVGLALRAFFLTTGGGLSMANYMMHGAAESSQSALFTYTSDLVEDSASSGRSRSTASSVNQPLQGAPPALPVMQEAANRAPPYVPYPHPLNEIIGGDSVESIQRRLLGTNFNPSAHDIRMAQIQAEDLFEVKVDIIRKMAGLHPSGDWMGRGARALDNHRTATGEEDLARLHQMLDDLQSGNFQSATFRLLVERVRLRAGEDQHSAT